MNVLGSASRSRRVRSGDFGCSGSALRRRMVGLLLAWIWVVSGRTDGAELAAAAKPTPAQAGLLALKEDRLVDARRAFTEALTVSGTAGDRSAEGEAQFYLGVMDQREALAASDAGRRGALLDSARSRYEQALASSQQPAGILNNLAKVELELGKTNEALASLSKAVELNDARRGFYAENYADLLLTAGRWGDACQFYGQVAAEQPRNRGVHRKLVELCMQKSPDLLGWYLWDLARDGQVVQVLDHALGVLDNPVWSSRQKEELMGLVAYCLSRKVETSAEFFESSAGRRLQQLTADPSVGRGVKELLLLYGERLPETPRFDWWQSLIEPGVEARRGIWPFEAFLQLLRSLAERAVTDQNPKRQEQLLLLAVGAKPGLPDPEALLGLANFYSERRETNRLDAMMQRYEVDIFQGKGQAYSLAQTEKIYRYHMALGLIYSQLDRWKTPREVNSAFFQLNRALATADRLNERPSPGATTARTKPLVVPPRLVELLAHGYEKVGQTNQAVTLRIERAEKYLDIGQPEAATRTIAPLKSRAVLAPAVENEAWRTRWNQVNEKLARPAAQRDVAAPGPVQVRVAPVASTVAGDTGRRNLSVAERKDLESSIGIVLQELEKPAWGKDRGSGYRSLNTNAVPGDVQEVVTSQGRGHVLLRKGTNLVQVPFVVEGGAKASRQSVRLVRP